MIHSPEKTPGRVTGVPCVHQAEVELGWENWDGGLPVDTSSRRCKFLGSAAPNQSGGEPREDDKRAS